MENILIIAAYLEGSVSVDAGAIYIFTLSSPNTFTQSQRIVPRGLQGFAHFGEDMLIIDDILFVGAHRQNAYTAEGGTICILVIA